jgi:general secretion pathway protein D
MQKTPFYRFSRTALALVAMASSMPALVTSANAGEGGSGLSSLAQREMVRRQEDVAKADALLNEGREAYTKGEYQKSIALYESALDLKAFINPSAPNIEDRHKSISDNRSDAVLALAMEERKIGKYVQARILLEELLKKDPENTAAKREIGFLDDPIRTNPALTYEHTQNVDKVRRDLYTAEGNFNLGKYDDAKVSYEKVLRVDPYNTAARRGMEQVANAKSDYYRAAYDNTRAELLSQVDAAWEVSVPAVTPAISTTQFGQGEVTEGVAYINRKLNKIRIPRIDFEDTTVEEAIDFIRLRAAELDTEELDPAKKGVNIVIRRPRANLAAPVAPAAAEPGAADALPAAVEDPGSLRVRELRVRDVPLVVALRYICDQTKLRYKVDDFAVTLVPFSESNQDFFSRTFRVPPDFATALGSAGEGGEAAAADPFAAENPTAGKALKLGGRPPILELLKNAGITFNPGSSATLSNAGVLLVTNTSTELDKVEQLVQTVSNTQPKQVKITTKFVEIKQENTDELGFDWMISAFGIGNSLANSSTTGSGGTTGNQLPSRTGDFTGVDTNLPTDIVTAGNRSGDTAINRNSIDSLLNNPNRTSQLINAAPGILGLTGLFRDIEMKMIMRGLAQKKGVDLMTAPSVVAKSGQKALIEVIREFIYPTEFEPPQVTQGAASTSRTIDGEPLGGSTPLATPASPSAWATRNLGITLEIEPTIGENDFLVDLRFVPQITEFDGFINYGSPINVPNPNYKTLFPTSSNNPQSIAVTENRIDQPIFSTRRVSTSMTIYDGYTVACGGLMREDVQNVEDKVPILGDIPYVGRLFQSKSENRIKSNLIIFVTAQIIDSTGRPLRGAETGQVIPVSATPAVGSDPGEGVLPPL